MRLEWHGDTDFGTGELERVYKAYRSRLKNMDVLKLNALLKQNTVKILQFLSVEQEQVNADNRFIAESMYSAFVIGADHFLCSTSKHQ